MGRANAYACYRELGEHLKKLRKAKGLSGTELGHRLGWSASKVSRVESGQTELRDLDLIHYVGALGIYGNKANDLLAQVRFAARKIGYWLSPHGERLPNSLTSLIFHETTADRCTTYEPQLVPGLLQTADYARARIDVRGLAPGKVARAVQIRMDRQNALRMARHAPFIFFLCEKVLRLQVGSAAVMHEQMLKLVLLAALDHVVVRVVPTAAEEPWEFGGPFRLFEYDEHKPLVYLDNHSTGLFLEDKEFVDPYRELVPAIAQVALDEGQSRELIAALASEYDQGSERDAGHSLEEEQL